MEILDLALDRLRPNPDQPRKSFDEGEIESLAESIRGHGLINPIAVKAIDDGSYVIVAGERRFRAFQHLGRPAIPAIVTEGDVDEVALIENTQREDLHPVELADALARMKRLGYNNTSLAKLIGKDRTTVSHLLRINTLPADIKTEANQRDDINRSQLIAIAALPPEKQHAAWKDVKGGGGTVRAVRRRRHGSGVSTTLRAGRKFTKKLAEITEKPLAQASDEYLELLKLQSEITRLISEIPLSES